MGRVNGVVPDNSSVLHLLLAIRDGWLTGAARAYVSGFTWFGHRHLKTVSIDVSELNVE